MAQYLRREMWSRGKESLTDQITVVESDTTTPYFKFFPRKDYCKKRFGAFLNLPSWSSMMWFAIISLYNLGIVTSQTLIHTGVPIFSGGRTQIYYRTSWKQPLIEYIGIDKTVQTMVMNKVGFFHPAFRRRDSWYTCSIKPSCTVFKFTDSTGLVDDNNHSLYSIARPGHWAVIGSLETSIKLYDFTIYYQTKWTSPRMRYKEGDEWTTVEMMKSNMFGGYFSKSQFWFRYRVRTASPLYYVFTDGVTVDDNSGSNYTAVSGSTWFTVSKIAPPFCRFC